MNHSDLLIEIGIEELPAASVLPMADSLGSSLASALADAGFSAAIDKAPPQVFATPRRLAVLIKNVAAQQQDQAVERKGPSVAAAYDDKGEPSKALQGFARSCGVEPSELETVATDKGDWLMFKSTAIGLTLAAFLSEHLPKALKQLPSPRRMRWSDSDIEFLRPLRWLTALHGSELVPLQVLGLDSVPHTYGHRFHAPGELALASASAYSEQLRSQGYVLADYQERRQKVTQEVEQSARQAGAGVVMDAALVDEVTSLVEWPVAIAGRFDERFLSLPKEALIQTMEENQRYFALLEKDGSLNPGFITVANIESSNVASVKEGNERVIRPRFADTLFFWEKDREQTLEARLPQLEKVLFQKELGTLYDKTERLQSIASFLADRLNSDRQACERAAKLAKCDLVTETVGELAKMQGIAGSYLAQADGESDAVATALREQYLPLKSGGQLPETVTGQILSLADKTDLLVGIFGIGQKPSGAKDPFALRRAAVGLLRILIEGNHSVDLAELFNTAATAYGDRLAKPFKVDELIEFVMERLRGYYLDRGERYDVIDAVAAKGLTDMRDFNRRVTAIAGFRQSEAADSLAAASKRINNILKKASGAAASINDEQLIEPAEKHLAESLQSIALELEPQFRAGDYIEAMRSTAKLRESVDNFFDNVMVMVDDETLKANRLALLTQVADLCSRTADLSQLQPSD